MSDAVSRVIAERDALDGDFRRSLLTSSLVHGSLLLAALGSSVFHRTPPLRVADGFAVVMPRGGGGPASTAPPAPVEAPPPAAPAPAQPAPPPKVVKPPRETPNQNRLPEVDSKKVAEKSKKPAAPVPGTPGPTSSAAAAVPGGGVGLVPGPGVPDGTDAAGDWYLAGVQRKVWTIWMQHLHAGMAQAAVVAFVINDDGSVSDVRLVQSSGSSGIDLAAQRSIYSAQPFGPLPKTYGTNRISIQASFKPDS